MDKFNGFIVVNKRKGIGSTDYVRIVRKILKQKSVGHSGTLDLLASGVLVICVGKATKTIEYLQNEKKTYIANIQFGKQTNTLDAEGEVINSTNKKVNYNDLINVIPKFIGEIYQIPPMFSAIKQNGKRLYNLARAGITVERKKRKTNIFSIEVLDFNYDKQSATVKTQVSAGTYIRTLIDDIASSLDNYAYMSDLNRIECSGFKIESSIDIIDKNIDAILSNFIKLEDMPIKLPKIILEDELIIKQLKNGMTQAIDESYSEGIYCVFRKNKILGIGKIFKTMKGTMLKLDKHLYNDENNWHRYKKNYLW